MDNKITISLMLILLSGCYTRKIHHEVPGYLNTPEYKKSQIRLLDKKIILVDTISDRLITVNRKDISEYYVRSTDSLNLIILKENIDNRNLPRYSYIIEWKGIYVEKLLIRLPKVY